MFGVRYSVGVTAVNQSSVFVTAVNQCSVFVTAVNLCSVFIAAVNQYSVFIAVVNQCSVFIATVNQCSVFIAADVFRRLWNSSSLPPPDLTPDLTPDIILSSLHRALRHVCCYCRRWRAAVAVGMRGNVDKEFLSLTLVVPGMHPVNQ